MPLALPRIRAQSSHLPPPANFAGPAWDRGARCGSGPLQGAEMVPSWAGGPGSWDLWSASSHCPYPCLAHRRLMSLPHSLILVPKGEERKGHSFQGQVDQPPCCSLTGPTHVPQADYINSLSLSFPCWLMRVTLATPLRLLAMLSGEVMFATWASSQGAHQLPLSSTLGSLRSLTG